MEQGIRTNDGASATFFDNLPFLKPDVGGWLSDQARRKPDAPAVLFLRDNGSREERLTFAQLDRRARVWAAWFRAEAQPGDRVLLIQSPGADYLAAFFGCQYAGMIAVPAYPARRTRHGDRLASVVADCGAVVAATDAVGRASILKAAAEGGPWGGLRMPDGSFEHLEPLPAERRWRPAPDDLAFLQYTSGSTGDPKGVMVSHANLAHNIMVMAASLGYGPDSVSVSWAPLFHDMGLIMGALAPLAWGGRCVLMAPNEFLQRPLSWLEAISAHRGTHSAAPNFAYDLCASLADQIPPRGLDLGSWRSAANGAEPIRPATLGRFEDAFHAFGFRRGVLRPCYGMAENTLFISGGPEGQPWRGASSPAGEGGADLMACGGLLNQEIRVVDPQTLAPCAPGEVGEFWLRGASVARGYWRKPKETQEAFGATPAGEHGVYLRTGDLGYLDQGQVVVTGRLKDLIILRGVNHYPQDLEFTAAAAASDLKAAAAFAVNADEGEAVVLVQEVGRHPRLPLPELARRIASALAEAHGVSATVVLVPQGQVPKTSSGKLQRRACRQAWLEGRLDVQARWPEAPAKPAPPAGLGEDSRAWALKRLNELGAHTPDDGWDAPLAAWGLDSLRVTQFLAELQRRNGKQPPMVEPADEPLGLLLSSFSPALRPADGPDPAPPRRWQAHASMAGLWAAQQLAPASSAYHIAWTLRLKGRPDAAKLQRALDALARQQASLRCAFEQDPDGLLWQVDQGRGAVLERPWPTPGTGDEARAWCQAWNQRAFDPSRAPLWRAALLPLEDGEALLAFSFHHLIFDQRSLEALYLGLEAGYQHPESLDEPGFPAPHWPGQESLRAESTAYWRERLRGLQAWALPAAPGSEPASLTLKAVLGEEVLAALRRLAVSERCTPFTVAACAWAEALAEAGGRGEACFATPFTLRDQPLSDRQIGYWVHPLPLRLSGRPDQDAGERLRQAAAAVREAMAHRGLSLAEALRCANAPFPEAFLVYQGELELPRTWLGLEASLSPIANAGLKAALALEISGERAWALSLEYDPARLPTPRAELLLRAFERAARRMAASAAAPQAPLIRGEALPAGGPDNVLGLFRERARRRPGATALLWSGGSWDYATLAAKAQSVARSLEARGLRPGDAVGVHCPAAPAWAAAVLGCFESGAVYVPLDPAYPGERLRHMHSAAGCRAVLGLGARPDFVEPRDWLDLDQAMAAEPSPPGPEPRGSAAAYVIFTSGSSGRPKGVQVGHAALANHARGYARRLGLAEGDRVLQFVSISFDPSLEELLPALCSGAALALPQRQGAPGVEELAAWTRVLGVTVLHLPAAYWHAVMQAGGAAALAAAPDLRAVVVGGEAPDPRWVEALGAALGSRASFFNAYGPTEACISATLWEWPCASAFDGRVPLGAPLPGVCLALVDGQGRAVAAGAEGELWIGGDALAHGYLGAAEAAGRFVEADLDGQGPRRYYRSGDRAQVDAQGRLFYRGRADRQVKAAGVRLDLEEIEGLLAQADGVRAAAVSADGAGESLRLRAWVVPQDGRVLAADGLRAWLSRHLPAAALPANIEICASLPLTPNGKVDRRGLAQAPPGPEPEPEPPADAGTTGLALCCQAFALALGLPSVGPDTDFFAAGGSSLRAVRLAAEAGRLLERNVLVEQVYQASTPRALAGLLFGAPARGAQPLRLMAGNGGLDWVLLPPVSGRLECYQALANALGAQDRVWGLDLEQLPAPQAEGWQDWVRACAVILRQELDGRPLVLGGWSMGGLLAADLAHALLEQGVEVRRLVLIDAVLPDPLHSALLRSDDQVLDELVERDLPAAAGGASGRDRERYKQHARALGSFRARSLGLPLSLVVSERTAQEQPRLGWMTWALMARKGMTTLMVSGDHFSVLGNASLPRIARRLLEDTATPAAVAGGPQALNGEGRHAYEIA